MRWTSAIFALLLSSAGCGGMDESAATETESAESDLAAVCGYTAYIIDKMRRYLKSQADER